MMTTTNTTINKENSYYSDTVQWHLDQLTGRESGAVCWQVKHKYRPQTCPSHG